MFGEYAALLVAAVLVNNFVLVQFLGLCPFMGVSNKLDTAIGMSAATTFVLTLASVCSFLTYEYLLTPLDLTYLRTLSFILVIAVVVQFTEMVVRKTSPSVASSPRRLLATHYDQLCGTWCCATEYQSGTQFHAELVLWTRRGAGLLAGARTVCGDA